MTQATCTEDSKCQREGCTYVERGSKLPHNYEGTITAPTCTEFGFTTYTCKVCKDTYTDEYKNATGHTFTTYTSNNDATCAKDGTKTSKCEKCKLTLTMRDYGSKLEHNYEGTVTAPTCTELGYTTYTCKTCRDTYTDEYKNATGHTFTKYTSNNDATCTEDGTKTSKCDKCDVKETITDKGSKLGHNMTQATCTEDSKCQREGCTYVDVGSKVSHNYEDGKCKDCKVEEPKLKITSEVYSILEEYITKITPNTTFKEFKEKITTNAEKIEVFDKYNRELIEKDKIGTGMTLKLTYGKEIKIFRLVVIADINGDARVNLQDLISVNKHRINKKLLEGEAFLAAEVTGDGKVDFKDLIKVNRYRLNKITK